MQVYNSLSNEKEKFEPLEKDEIKMYVCGQTVYDYMHVGHARTYVSFDIIRRFFENQGYMVNTVINITDVNDKINRRAEEENRSPWEVAEEFSRVMLEDFKSLGIKADAFPKSSEYIEEMIEIVQDLEEKEIAYEVEGDVFFDVKKFEDYGKLSNQEIEEIESEREEEIKSSGKKKHEADFVLWKSREGGKKSPTWDSPWGEGVPGWHIECSAMAISLLGEHMDIHGGGSDLVFPHHENEIAQVEGISNKNWVKYWMHAGLVKIEGEKMSKSLGNFASVREILKDHDPEALRLMVAGSHYREPMNFSEEKIERTEKRLERLRNTVKTLRAELRKSQVIPEKFQEKDTDFINDLFKHKRKFLDALKDDFNTPEALSYLYEMEKSINSYITGKSPKRPAMERALDVFLELCSIFGILEEEKSKLSENITGSVVEEILKLRDNLRDEGEYEKADAIRESLKRAGIEVEDTDEGPRWKV